MVQMVVRAVLKGGGGWGGVALPSLHHFHPPRTFLLSLVNYNF